MTLRPTSRRTRLALTPSAPPTPDFAAVGPLAFRIRTLDGRTRGVDLSGAAPAALARTLAAAIWADCGPSGQVSSLATLNTRTAAVRRFCAHVAATLGAEATVRDLTPEVLDSFETTLLERHPAPSNMPYKHAENVLGLLRIAADAEALDPRLVERARWGPRAPYRTDSSPVEPYDTLTAQAIRRACRRHVGEVLRRMKRGNALADAGSDPELSPAGWSRLENVLWAIRERGPIGSRELPNRIYEGLPLTLSEAHELVFPRRRDLLPFAWYLTLECGLEPVCASRLLVSCLQNASPGRVDIHYRKGRARGHEEKFLNESDAGTFSSGGLIRAALLVTENVRAHAPNSNALWLWWSPALTAIGTALDGPPQRIDAEFIERHALVDENGSPLRSIGHRRLRKTNKTDEWLSGSGNLSTTARGHQPATFGNRYARVDALKSFHEGVVATGLTKALNAAIEQPVVLTPEDEQRAREGDDQALRDVATQLGITHDDMRAVLGGENDAWVSACRDPRSGAPDTPDGSFCRSSFLGCLECRNAVFYQRKLPALVALEGKLAALTDEMADEAWAVSYGRAWTRLQQVFSRFSDAEMARARRFAESEGVLFIPPTQAA